MGCVPIIATIPLLSNFIRRIVVAIKPHCPVHFDFAALDIRILSVVAFDKADTPAAERAWL